MFDFTSIQAIITVIASAIMAGLFGALKYYSNTLGDNPESFDLGKFTPIAILGIGISLVMAVFASTPMTASDIATYITGNFFLVVFANTLWTAFLKTDVYKKYFAKPSPAVPQSK